MGKWSDSYMMAAFAFNPFMRKVEEWPNTYLKFYGVDTAQFLKCVAIFNIMHESVYHLPFTTVFQKIIQT